MMTEREIAQMTDYTTRAQNASVRSINIIEKAQRVKSMGAEGLARQASDLLVKANGFLGRCDVRNAGITVAAAESNLDRSEKMVQTCLDQEEEDRRTADDRRRKYNGTSALVSETVAKQLHGLKLRAA